MSTFVDNYYPVEVKICSKNGWHTPQEARAYYGRYDRSGICIHHWALNGAQNHDNIVNYFLGQAEAGNKSVNYVVSDGKITLMVSPDNVNWAQQNGNPTQIGVEHQSDLGAEGYKKSGWLVNQLEERYGRLLELSPHSRWFQTACPANIDINRIRAEANKWKVGGYNPAPAPVPVPVVPPAPTVQITYSVLPSPVAYTTNKDTDLWNFNTATWAGFKSVKRLVKGEAYSVYAIADNHSTHSQYGVTQYSFDRKITNGVNMKDLDLVTTPVQPTPTPPVVPVAPPVVDPDRNAIIAFLTGLIKTIAEFLAKFKP